MQSEKKYFVSSDSYLDSDSADFSVPKNAWVNMENFRTGTTDVGVIGTVESIGSTSLIKQQDEEFLAIGSAFDEENQRFITFYYSSLGNHKIECSYANDGTTYIVLKSADVIGGLNFTKEPIHSSAIIGNLLSWANGTNNQPRKINIESGIKAYQSFFQTDAHSYTLPLNFSEITLIKAPPAYSPNIQKIVDQSFVNNFIATTSFEFAYQFIYYDGEISVVGTYSNASKLNYQTEKYNCIRVTMDSFQRIPDTVKLVNLIVRVQDGSVGGGNYATIIKTWNKEINSELTEINNQNDSVAQLSFNFFNNITGEVIATDDVLRPFDNVPIYSKTMEVAKYRQFLANNTEGYDTPEGTSLSSSLTNLFEPASTTQTAQIYYVQSYYQQSSTGAEDWKYQAFFVKLPSYGNGWYVIASTEQYVYGYGTNLPTPITPPSIIAISNLIFKGNNPNEVGVSVTPNGYPNAEATIFTGPTPYPNITVTITGINNVAYSVFPQLSSYKLGVVFYDYALRKSGVVVRTSSSNFNTIAVFNDIPFELVNPNTLRIVSNIGLSINVGDIVIISNATSGNGTYTIKSISNTGGAYINFTTFETIATSPNTNGTITITRLASLDISTPQRTYNYTYGFGGIQWGLSNTNAIGEIPDWAYYYSVVSTLNLRTRFLVQGFTDALCYATKDQNGQYVFNSTNHTFNPTSVAIGVKINALSFAGLGYVYTEGDICILTRDDNAVFNLPIIGQQGEYAVIKVADIGDTSNRKFVFELYTPYQTSTQEPYYEIGELYAISNPTTSQRQYTATAGIISADTFAISRSFQNNTYWANAMSPNDLFYKRWDTDAGKTNFITNQGQVVNKTGISWSDAITTGTRVNGTSTFRLGNRKFVPDESGEINKLIFTSKVQEAGQGMIMLAISSHETNSLYLGETQITDNTGATQFFSGSTEVVGTINTLKGSLGTANPEAVVEFRGQVFYPDAHKGVWVQYSSNGLFPISNYKTTRFWKSFFKQYLSTTTEQFEALGSRPYIFTAVDNAHLELLISIPKLTDVPIKTVPDYDFAYPFDMWDGQGKTIVFCLEGLHPQSHWQGSYSFNPELFTTVGNNLYSNKNGSLWIHNQTNEYNRFYDLVYPSKIMFVSNEAPTKQKVYNNITVQANTKPALTYFYNDFPYLQTSDLLDTDYREYEGIYYSPIYRNKIVPTNTGYTTDGLLTFEKMRNTAMKIMLEFDLSKNNYNPIELKFVDIGFDISNGHTT
jgi:hypothetical protein